MDIVSSLVSLVIVLLVLGFLAWVLTQFSVPEPFGRILQALIYLVAGVLVVLFVLGLIGIGPGFHPLLLRG